MDNREEINKIQKMQREILKMMSETGDIHAKILLQWDEVNDVFRKILDDYVKIQIGDITQPEKLDKILSFFTQINQLTKDFKEELDSK